MTVPESSTMLSRWYRSPAVWFWVVFLVGVVLRARNLTVWDMWTDEANTFFTAAADEWVSGPMYRSAPINFYLTRLAIQWLGPNELGARFVPFLTGVVTLALFYPVFRRRLGNRAAILGTLALALSSWHIYWSQTARHFSLQTLFLLLTLAALLRFRDGGSRFWMAGAAVGVTLALFSHSSAGFFLAGFLVFVWMAWIADRKARGLRSPWSREDRRALVALAALVVVFLVYLPVYIRVGSYTLQHRTAWNPPWNIIGSLVFYVPPYVALPAVGGFVLLLRERRDLALLLGSLVVVPVILVTIASSLTIASASYCLASVLPVCALVGVGADRLLALAKEPWGRLGTSVLVGGIFLGQAYDCALYHTYYNGLKARWKELCAVVRDLRGPDEMFLADEGDTAQFYLGRENARWFGQFQSSIGTASFPPPGVRGIWYGIYLAEGDILGKPKSVLGHILERGRLVRSFPLHYGPKDRSLALFHEAVNEPFSGGSGDSP